MPYHYLNVDYYWDYGQSPILSQPAEINHLVQPKPYGRRSARNQQHQFLLNVGQNSYPIFGKHIAADSEFLTDAFGLWCDVFWQIRLRRELVRRYTTDRLPDLLECEPYD